MTALPEDLKNIAMKAPKISAAVVCPDQETVLSAVKEAKDIIKIIKLVDTLDLDKLELSKDIIGTIYELHLKTGSTGGGNVSFAATNSTGISIEANDATSFDDLLVITSGTGDVSFAGTIGATK